MAVVIRFPWPPSTNNHMTVARGRFVPADNTRRFRALADVATFRAPRFGDARVALFMTFHCSTRRRYDCSNFVKEIEDALTRAHVWEDDSQVDELHLYRGSVSPRDGHVIVKIERIEP